MSSEMGKDQADLHRSVHVVRGAEARPAPLSRDRGRQWQLFGPDEGAGIDLHRIELRPGGVPGYYHLHSSSENVYVLLEGSLEIRHPEGVTMLAAGDAILFPPGVPHSARCVGNEPAVLIELYSPAPTDFVRVDDGHDVLRS